MQPGAASTIWTPRDQGVKRDAVGKRGDTMQIYKWFDRKFTLDMPVDMFLPVLERVRGTPVRLEELTAAVPVDVLTRREGRAWSIQENIGHLLDLEPLGDGRLDDFEQGAETLRPADVENKRTNETDHNAADIQTLLRDFRAAREAIVARFESYDEAFVMRTALHPRLRQEMRVMDLAWFIAEHDDHHLARISQLKAVFMR